MSRIRTANPQPGSAQYASFSRAERFVPRKEAVMVDNELHFLTQAEKRKMRTFIQTIQSERRASDVYIRGIVWWDGRDPGGMHRPCEVIIFSFLTSGLRCSTHSFHGFMHQNASSLKKAIKIY
jgi:hypothetical protein